MAARIIESVTQLCRYAWQPSSDIEAYEIGSSLLTSSKAMRMWLERQRINAAKARISGSLVTTVLGRDYLFGCSGRNEPDSDFRCIK